MESFCQPYRSTYSVSQMTSVADSFNPPTLKMILTQPTQSKRKVPPAQVPDNVSEDHAEYLSGDDSSAVPVPGFKKSKIDRVLTSSQDVNLDQNISAASESDVTLFTAVVPSPTPAISPNTLRYSSSAQSEKPPLNHSPLMLVSQPPSDIPDDQSQGSNTSREAAVIAVDQSQKVDICQDSEVHESESHTPNLVSTCESSLEKADWVPSILRADPNSEKSHRTVQMIVDTSRASWNSQTRSARPLKERSYSKKKAVSSSERMRSSLKHFMLGGLAKPPLRQNNQFNVEDGDDNIDDANVEDNIDDEDDDEGYEGLKSDAENELDEDIDQRDSQAPFSHEAESAVQSPQEHSEEVKLTCGSNISAAEVPTSDDGITRISSKQGRKLSEFGVSKSHMRRVVREKEIITSREPAVFNVSIHLPDIVGAWEKRKNRRATTSKEMKNADENNLQGAGLDQGEIEAESVLSRNVKKDDFEHMEIIGQFNLGFIIARRRDEENSEDDLFIIDQHASDEKFNFEKLQRETKLTGQRLIIPKVMDLTAAAEITAIEHLELLEFNGFSVQIDEAAKVGQRVRLLAQPVSGNIAWDVSDLEELLHLIDERGTNEIVRPNKTRRMMASRACRMSTMIGDALTTRQMSQIVKQMGTMDQPWACPHGRPTMRWLTRCNDNPRKSDPRYRISDWIDGKIEF